MLSNKCANYINQTLAAIKLVTYLIIAIAGIYRLFANWDTSRINWQQPLDGNVDFTAYSTAFLLVAFSWDGWNSLNCESFKLTFFFIVIKQNNNRLFEPIDSLDEVRDPETQLIYSNTISIGVVAIVCMYILSLTF